LPYSGVKVAANASSWPPSALRMADLIIGLSSRTGPVMVQPATRLTRVPSPCRRSQRLPHLGPISM
jgi:hypothetical protein